MFSKRIWRLYIVLNQIVAGIYNAYDILLLVVQSFTFQNQTL